METVMRHEARQVPSWLIFDVGQSMNEVAEIQESCLAGVTEDRGLCVIHVRPAYLHRSYGRPGIDPGKVYQQDLRIEITDAIVRAHPTRLPATLLEVDLRIGDEQFVEVIPTNIQEEKKIVLRLSTVTE